MYSVSHFETKIQLSRRSSVISHVGVLYDHLIVKFKQYVVEANDITVNEYGVFVD